MNKSKKNRPFLNFVFVAISFIYLLKAEGHVYDSSYSLSPSSETYVEQTLESDLFKTLQKNLYFSPEAVLKVLSYDHVIPGCFYWGSFSSSRRSRPKDCREGINTFDTASTSLTYSEKNFLNGLRFVFPPAPIIHFHFTHSPLQVNTPVQSILFTLQKSHMWHQSSDDNAFYEIC